MRQFKESQGSLSLTILLVYVYASLTFNNSYNKVAMYHVHISLDVNT